MGLAASQARFLSLTAKKTNIEYEGQQINQQRMTLANQSASIYNQMLTLSVPVPPSETSFQTVSYSFSYNGDPATINQVVNNPEGGRYDYKVSITYAQTDDKIAYNNNSTINKVESDYYYNGTKLVTLKSLADAGKLDENGIKNAVNEAIREYTGSASSLDANNIMVAVKGSEENPSYTYFSKNDLNFGTETKKSVASYKEQNITSYKQKVVPANITRDANNRIASISYDDVNNSPVTATTVKDEAAYDDAYNEYTYQTYLYEQEMEAINAETSIIQAQDKKLELRLKQLDTEQSAISTELESINSVIDKNIQDSFKVFA